MWLLGVFVFRFLVIRVVWGFFWFVGNVEYRRELVWFVNVGGFLLVLSFYKGMVCNI